MGDRPSIGDRVVLRDDAGFVYTSRIEGVDGDLIAVARPADLRAAVEYPEGLELELVRTLATGVHVVPTRLAGTSVENRVRLWHLAVTGSGWTEQRRDYARAPATGRVALAAVDIDGGPGAAADPADRLAGELLDISEVAAQCAVPLPLDDPRIAVGRAVRCEFAVNEHAFDLRGTITIVRSGTATRDSRVVVRFEGSRATADALRKEVFALQLAARRQR